MEKINNNLQFSSVETKTNKKTILNPKKNMKTHNLSVNSRNGFFFIEYFTIHVR